MTVHMSSLGPAFQQSESHLCMDSFHGYTHNYTCQTQNHPLRIEDTGLEDFSVSEHIFSASNALAPVIRYASPYHGHMFLDMFFMHWDEEMYANLSTLLLNNYRQALDIIQHDTVALQEVIATLNIQDGDLDQWQAEEVEYFHTLGKEPEGDIHATVYVELLQDLWTAE
jgi:hypothetical protein